MNKKDFEIVKNKLMKLGLDSEDIILSVSGGADSVMLHYLANKYKVEAGIKEIFVVHFNHNLRADESKKDALFTEKISMEYNNKFIYKDIYPDDYAKKSKLSLEEAARELRYNGLIKIADEFNIKHIFTGHNKNDVVETFLINLFRVSGINGLTGLSETVIIKDKIIFRPLLNLSKEKIIEYLNNNNIKFRIDKSNYSNIYLRNKIRNKIIPYINETLNINAVNQIYSVYNNLISAKSVISEILYEKYLQNLNYLKICNKKIPYLNFEKICENTDELYYYLNYLYKETVKKENRLTPYILNKKNITDCIDMIEKNKKGKRIDVSGEYFFVKDYNKIFFLSKNLYKRLNIRYKYKIGSCKKIKIEETGTEISIQKIKNSSCKYDNRNLFDLDKVQFPLIIRNRREGDKFQPYKNKIRYKLKKYLINKKILNIYRNINPIITDANDNIIFVYPFGVSENYKISDFSKNVVNVEIR